QDEAVGGGPDRGVLSHPSCRYSEGRYGSVGQIREGRNRDQPSAGRGPREVPAYCCPDLVQVGQQGQGCCPHLQVAAGCHGVAELRLRDARHVQGTEAGPLTSSSCPLHGMMRRRYPRAPLLHALFDEHRGTMPSLPFVLPHWLYWTILVLFPLIAM